MTSNGPSKSDDPKQAALGCGLIIVVLLGFLAFTGGYSRAREEWDWYRAKAANRQEAYQVFLRNFEYSGHRADAQERISEIAWASIQPTPSIQGLRQFLAIEGVDLGGQHAASARKRIAALRAERTMLLTELSSTGRVEVSAKGAGISEVELTIKNLTSTELTVRISPALYFRARDPNVQNMVVVLDTTNDVPAGESLVVRVPAACANLARRIPGANDSFDSAAWPAEAPLSRVLKQIITSEVSFSVRQAAVWIITDDATRADISMLRSRQALTPVPSGLIARIQTHSERSATPTSRLLSGS